MAKDGTMRGSARVGSGRKSKALKEKIDSGLAASVIDLPEPEEISGEDVPPVKEFLKAYRSEVTKSMQLNYEFDRQLELERADAIEEGMEIGIEKGANKMLFTLVTKGKLDIDTAAEEAGVSVSEFEKLMSEAGYKVPETV